MKRKRWSEDMEKDNSNEQKNQNSSIFNSQEGLDILITAIEQTSVAMVITDLKADIIYVNNAFEKMTGYTKEEAIGQNPRILKSGLVAQEEYEKLWDVISNGGTWNGEQINKKKDGSYYYEDSRITPIYDKENKLKYYMALKNDITERKLLEARIREIAIKDSLTGSYSRWFVLERLKQISDNYKRVGNTFSLAIIDLDLFKEINDRFGHQAGDYMLKSFVQIVKNNIRSYDILGRYGGEEFILVLLDTPKEEAQNLVKRILEKVIDKDFLYKDQRIELRFSAGISDSKEIDIDDFDIDKLIEIADKRLYKAKEEGRARIIIE